MKYTMSFLLRFETFQFVDVEKFLQKPKIKEIKYVSYIGYHFKNSLNNPFPFFVLRNFDLVGYK